LRERMAWKKVERSEAVEIRPPPLIGATVNCNFRE
jgi:hypothetical protein